MIYFPSLHLFRPHFGAALLSVVLIALQSPTLAAERSAGDESEILRHAIAQTVEVRTAIEYGFGAEDPGTFQGAGFIIDRQRGWIATARHVAGVSASRVLVSIAGGPHREAEKRYVDPILDLAILEVDPQYLVGSAEAKLDCRNEPTPGQQVITVGHPASLKYSVTRGIVSRMANIDGETLIQTDAAISPGNSGGPLLSLRTGRILGIAVKHMNRNNGAGFALPVEGLCRIQELLRQGRNPAPPDLPVSFLAMENVTDAPKVARLWTKSPNLPLMEGDRITGVVDSAGKTHPVHGVSGLINALRGLLDNVVLQVSRSGEMLTLKGQAAPATLADSQDGLLIGGVLFARSERYLQRGFATETLRVHQVTPASDGEMKGIQVIDFLVAVNGRALTTLDELERLASQEQSLTLTLRRVTWESARVSYLEKTLLTQQIRRVGGKTVTSNQ